MSRGSKKPCPGCKEVEHYRPANEVCSECARLLKEAAWMEERLNKMADDEIVVMYGERYHWNKYIYSRASVSRDLMKIFQRLAEAASRPTTKRSSEVQLLGDIDPFAQKYVIINKLLAETIIDLRREVQVALELEYKQGKKDGTSLLMGLADGSLSAQDFNDRTNRR